MNLALNCLTLLLFQQTFCSVIVAAHQKSNVVMLDEFENYFRQLSEKDDLDYARSQQTNNEPRPGVFRTIVQRLDHFDSQNTRTYKQRYLVNDAHWRRPDGPVILNLSGEWPMWIYAAVYGSKVEYARQHGALILALEHRFYGKSLNKDGLQLINLRYLSSHQALADAAYFRQYMSARYNMTEENKWIAIGGSYPGNLAAWMRTKYPHLIHAAVASSAPVRAVVGFSDYLNVVATSLGRTDIGGSPECVTAVNNAFATLDQLLEEGRLDQLVTDFNLCQPFAARDPLMDVWMLTRVLASMFMGRVQYNAGISRMCDRMTQSNDSYENFVPLARESMGRIHLQCNECSWKSFIHELQNVTVEERKIYRQWMYQKCTEFGYYKICDDSVTDCPFSYRTSIEPFLRICKEVYQLDPRQVYDRVEFTNNEFGADEPRGSRILFTNGEIDPWHALSVLHNVTDSELSVLIPDTAHCADMRPERPRDSESLKAARRFTTEQLGIWLQEPF